MSITWFPYPDYRKSVACLCPVVRRQQVYNCKEILEGRFIGSPIHKMWIGYEQGLIRYAIAACRTGRRPHSSLPYFTDKLRGDIEAPMPEWIADPKVNSTHRAMLLLIGDMNIITDQLGDKAVEFFRKHDCNMFPKNADEVRKIRDAMDLDGYGPGGRNPYWSHGWKEVADGNLYWPCLDPKRSTK